MKQSMRLFAQTVIVASAAASAGFSPAARADFNAEQMQAMSAAASVLGEQQAAGDACGTDMAPMAKLIARGWTCQGASADQIAKLQATMTDARKKGKVAACPTDKAAHGQQIAQSTAALEAGLVKANCKG
jgi:hypothetical protein